MANRTLVAPVPRPRYARPGGYPVGYTGKPGPFGENRPILNGIAEFLGKPQVGDMLSDLGRGLMTGKNLSEALALSAQYGAEAEPYRDQRADQQRQRSEAQKAREGTARTILNMGLETNDPFYQQLADNIANGSLDVGAGFNSAMQYQTTAKAKAEELRKWQSNAQFIPDPEISEAVATGRLDFKTGYDMWQSGQELADADESLVEIYDPETGLPQKGYMQGSEFVPLGGTKAPTQDGTGLVIGPDGTVMFSQGGGLPPSMFDPTRDPGKLGEKLSESDASMLTTARDAATAADKMSGVIDGLEMTVGNVGYTGFGGELYGTADDLIGILPGDSGSRGAVRSLGMEAQLALTSQTKGAITDREMTWFKAAVPGLGQTREGNEQIVAVMRAMVNRTQTRAAFIEEFINANGSANGAQAAWRAYIEENPILEKDPATGELIVNEEADPTPYLRADVGMTGSPGAGAPGAPPTATNPQTGQRVVWDGQQWVPAQ